MRIVLLASYFGSFLLDAFLSCGGPSAPAPAKTMRFSVDGQAHEASANLVASERSDSLLVSTYIPQAAPSPALNLYLKFPKAAGTYNLATPGAGTANFGRGAATSTDQYYAGTKAGTVLGSGTITVDKYADGTVTGTFHFTGQNLSMGATKTISDGSFSTQVR